MTNGVFWDFVCGILTPADDPKVWSNQAQGWVLRNKVVPAGNAAGFTYFDSVMGGPMHDAEQAQLLAQDLAEARAEGLRVRVMTHSNGGKIILATLKQRPDLVVDELHLVAPAVSNDCDANDLNNLAALQQVRRVVLYCSSGDEALGLGNLLGYGDLGKVGPRNMSIQLQAILQVVWADPPCLHSDWVGVNFEQTMRRVTGYGESGDSRSQGTGGGGT